MRYRSLSSLLVLILLAASMVTLAPLVHAAGVGTSCSDPEATDQTKQCGPNAFCDASKSSGDQNNPYVCSANPTPASGTQNPGSGTANQSTGSGLKDLGSSYGSVMTFIMGLFAWLVGVAALTLDTSVYYTVVHMGTYINQLSAIGVTWRILRDIGNIALIFGFIAVGINIILGVNWYGGGSKMLPMLLIAAVFLNFSLFIAEAIIDVGNLFGTEFYTQITGGQPPGTSAGNITGLSSFNTAIKQEGISNKLMGQLGLQNIYNGAQQNPNVFKSDSMWLVGFMGVLLFLTAAFVMFSLAFMFIARFVVLIFLIIVAPVGLVGLAVPNLASLAKQWWHQLFEQTVTAPVLLLMLYVALAVITDANFLTGFSTPGTDGAASSSVANSWDSIFGVGGTSNVQNFAPFAGVVLSFLVAMGLLLAVIIVAKRMSAFGASWATSNAGKVVGGFAGYGVLGGTSLAARGLLGVGLGGVLNNRWVQAKAANSNLAKAAAFSGRFLQNRTFDARSSKILSAAGGNISRVLASGGSDFNKIDLGKGATVTGKKAIESTKEFIKNYKPFSGEWWRSQQKEYEKAADNLERKKNIANVGSPDFEKTLKRMSVDELAELRGIRGGLNEFVKVLSPAKYSELQKSDKLLKGEKKKLRDAWQDQFTAANAAGTLARFSTEEVASLDGEMLSKPEVASNLKSTELENIRRKGNLTVAQRHDIHAHLSNPAAAAHLDFVDYLLPANDPGGARARYWTV